MLKGRKVILYPDLNGYDKWKKKADELSGIASFRISDKLETRATDLQREQGLDIADYLVCVKPRMNTATLPNSQPEPWGDADEALWPEIDHQQLIPSEDWSGDIVELETFFSTVDMATLQQPIQLNSHSTITDPQKYIDSHLATIKANNGKRWFRVYLERLWEVKECLNTTTKKR